MSTAYGARGGGVGAEKGAGNGPKRMSKLPLYVPAVDLQEEAGPLAAIADPLHALPARVRREARVDEAHAILVRVALGKFLALTP